MTEPLRKANDVADTIEFPSGTEGYAVVTRNVESKTVSAYNDADGNQVATTLPDDTILHIQNLYSYTQISSVGVVPNNISQRSAEIRITSISGANYPGLSMPLQSGKYYSSCLFKNEYTKPNVIYSNSGNSSIVSSSDYQKISSLKSGVTAFRYSALNHPTVWEAGNVFFFKDINIFDIDAMFADCTDLKPASNTAFETLFPNLGYIDKTDTAIDVIVKDGKLYKEDVTGIEILVPLATPTTELVDAPQIEEAESYTCIISQGGKAVSWSSFNDGILEFYDKIIPKDNAYINTGYIPTADSSFVVHIKRARLNNSCIYSNATQGKTDGIRFLLASNGIYVSFGASRVLNSGLSELELNIIHAHKKYITINGNSNTYITSVGNTYINEPLTIFSDYYNRSVSGQLAYFNGNSLYSFKIYENDVLVRDFKPCTYNGVAGLWDTVESKFYCNSNNIGTLTVSNDV